MNPVSWWRTEVGKPEISQMATALQNEHLSQGPIVAELESILAELLDVPYVMMTPSGSAALLMAMLAIDIDQGDEIIVPAYTWIATAHSGHLLGAKVRLADIERKRPIVSIEEIKKQITPKTKAVVPVHLNGRAADMLTLRGLADKYKFKIIEDACQSFLSKLNGQALGTFGDIGCFSLGVTKLITTGQGGFVATRDPIIYEKLRIIKSHGVRTDDKGLETYMFQGFNFKYTDFQAAMAIEQLKRLDFRINRVKEIDKMYSQIFPDLNYLSHVEVNVKNGEIPLWVEIESAHREDLIAFLAKNQIQTNRVHLSLKNAPHLGKQQNCEQAQKFSAQGLILPCGPSQPTDNVNQVIDCLYKFKS